MMHAAPVSICNHNTETQQKNLNTDTGNLHVTVRVRSNVRLLYAHDYISLAKQCMSL